MRLLLRFASFLALMAAVFAGTIDSIQSVAASEPVITSLADGIAAIGSDQLNWVQSLQRTGAGPAMWLRALHWVSGAARLCRIPRPRPPPVDGRIQEETRCRALCRLSAGAARLAPMSADERSLRCF